MYRLMLLVAFMALLSGCKTDNKAASTNSSGDNTTPMSDNTEYGGDDAEYDGDDITIDNAAPAGCRSLNFRMAKYSPDKKLRHENFIRMARAAYHCGDPHPAVVAAQWIEETGWNRHFSAKNNFFGIKAKKGQAGNVVRTTEYTSNKRHAYTDKFASYPTQIEGIIARVNFVKENPTYKKHGYFKATNPKEAAYALREACWGACNLDTRKPAPNSKGQYYDDVLVTHIQSIRYEGRALNPNRPLKFQIPMASTAPSPTQGSGADERGLN